LCPSKACPISDINEAPKSKNVKQQTTYMRNTRQTLREQQHGKQSAGSDKISAGYVGTIANVGRDGAVAGSFIFVGEQWTRRVICVHCLFWDHWGLFRYPRYFLVALSFLC
jgi:hypothetical protein